MLVYLLQSKGASWKWKMQLAAVLNKLRQTTLTSPIFTKNGARLYISQSLPGKRNFAANEGRIYSKSGAIMPRPVKKKSGLLKVFSLVVPFVMLGGYLSSTGAELLHEYDIFSPDDE